MPGARRRAGEHSARRQGAFGSDVGAVLLRGTGGTAAVQAAGLALTFALQLVLARQLGVAQYGYYAFALGCITLLAVLCRLGLLSGLTRFTAAYRVRAEAPALRGLAARGAQIVAGLSLVAGLLLAAGAFAMRTRWPVDLVWTFVLAGATLPLLALLGVVRGLLQGSRRPAQAMLPQRALWPAATLVLALAAGGTVGLNSAPLAMALTLGAALLVLALSAGWARAALAPLIAGAAPEYRTGEWLRVSLPLLLTSGMIMVMKHVDTIMLGTIVGTDAAGLYYPVARISEIAALGLASTNAIVAPLISELHATDERARLQRLLTLAALVTSAITLVVALALGLGGEWVLGLFGAAFTSAYPALVILLGGQIVNALCGPVGALMNMTGHQDRAAIVISVAAGLNIALNAALIPLYGLAGAAAATAVSGTAWNLWMFAEVRQRHGVNPSVFTRWPWRR